MARFSLFLKTPNTAPGARAAGALVAALAVSAGACASVEVEEPSAELGSTGLALTFDTLEDTDVAGFGFTATEVDCATGVPIDPANVYTATEDLEDMYLPGIDGMFADAPLAGDSQHLFSDHFFALPVGCYDVVAQPITEDGEPSEDCFAATDSNVEVVDGETTEILLLSQCMGDPSIGGLDLVAVLNHPPTLTAVTYDPSKFICESETTICVSAVDADSDPIVIVPSGDDWTLVDESVSDDGASCFTFSFPEPGDYNVTFTAYDMGYNADGSLISIEDLLAAQGDAAESNDAITVPVHVLPEEDCIDVVAACECPDGFDLTPAGDECVKQDSVPATATGDTQRVCRGDTNGNYSIRGGRLPGGGVSTDFPILGDFVGRMNDVGVWGCDSVDLEDQWVGFSVCIDSPETATYVIGAGGDDRMRVIHNGATFFDRNTNGWYFDWRLDPIVLSSGPNILQFEVIDFGGFATIAAELYGPFDPALTTTDADMATLDYDQIFWSTADIIGDVFTSGAGSGMTCPDGYELNACSGEILCTRIERVACQ